MIAVVPSWNSPPLDLTLDLGEIHVWRVSLAQTESCLQSLQQTLSTDERAKADRFRFPKDRSQFIVSRGALRAILSRYLNISSHILRFDYNPYGKPSLIVAQGGNTLRFNLSHSRGMALIAITKNRDIGVDIEGINQNFSCLEIAEKVFFTLRKFCVAIAPRTSPSHSFFYLLDSQRSLH
jgi:4'-phosphopantetheinyl transferase